MCRLGLVSSFYPKAYNGMPLLKYSYKRLWLLFCSRSLKHFSLTCSAKEPQCYESPRWQRPEVIFWPAASKELNTSAHEELNVNKHVNERGGMDPFTRKSWDVCSPRGHLDYSLVRDSEPEVRVVAGFLTHENYEIKDVSCLKTLFGGDL